MSMIEREEDEYEYGKRTDCPKGFDRWGFGNFVRHRDGRPVEAYDWGDGTIGWITTDSLKPMRYGLCLVRSFKSHHSSLPLNKNQ